MKREIKFRAWDSVLKEFLPNVQNHINDPEWAFGRMLKNDRWVVLQYTGLKDKNGVDIYEGDKIRFICIEDERKGHKSEATGVIEWDDEDVGFYILNDSDKYPHVKLWFAEDIEVVGNVYETSAKS